MNLKDAFAGMKEQQQPEAPPAASPKPAPGKRPVAVRSGAVPVLAVGKIAKSVDPEFEPVKIYIRKTTRRAASRQWEDADGGDFSELIEHLLRKYLGT